MRINIDVDNKDIARQIDRRIRKGIDNSTDEIARGIERQAKGVIRREGAVFRHHLLEGFEDATLTFGGDAKVRVRNVSKHGPAHEYGVSGTQFNRDTPLSYSDKKPPVTALIPWVRAHLVGTGFDPDYTPQGDNDGGGSGSSGSTSGGSSGGDGGTDVDSGNTVSGDDTDDVSGINFYTTGFQEDVTFARDDLLGAWNGLRGASIKEKYGGEWTYLKTLAAGDAESIQPRRIDTLVDLARELNIEAPPEMGAPAPLDELKEIRNALRDNKGALSEIDQYDPLMGAENLLVGDTGIVGTTWNGKGFSGEIKKVFPDSYEMDYLVDGREVKQEWITNFDGRGVDPDLLEVDQMVYVGDEDKFGKVTELIQDPEFGTTGAYVDFDGNGAYDDLYDGSQILIAEDKDTYEGFGDGLILTDENGEYVPGTNFRKFDEDQAFDTSNTYPGQRIVVWDTLDKKYRRATIENYKFQGDETLKVQFVDDGHVTDIEQGNHQAFRLAGGEFWHSKTTAEKKDLLRDYIDRSAYNSSKYQKFINAGEFDKPNSGLVNYIRDEWIDEVWDDYLSDEEFKETIRHLDGLFIVPSQLRNKGVAGGILPGDPDFVGRFWTKTQVEASSKIDLDKYEGTIHHESFHAWTNTKGYNAPGFKGDWSEPIKNGDWSRSGLNKVAGPDQPAAAVGQFFQDNAGDVVGEEDWVEETYDAAMNGRSGIRDYTPDFNTNKDEKVKRLLEAGNRAYWLQSVAAQDIEQNQGGINKNDPLFIQWAYSSLNAEETLATLTGTLTTPGKSTTKIDKLIREMDEHYPWLIEAWLANFNPGSRQAQILDQLGYNV